MVFQKGHIPWIKGKHHSKETKQKLSKITSFNRLGKKHTEEAKRKMSLASKGKPKSEEHKKKLSEALRKNPRRYWLGKKLPFEMIEKMKLKAKKYRPRRGIPLFKNRGKNNPNWKGGVTPIAKLIRCCFKYRQWRSDIFTRDDFTCVLCNQRGGYLIADHHPKLFSEIFHDNKIKSLEQAENCEELWNINNGRTLCKDCDKKYGHRYGKK